MRKIYTAPFMLLLVSLVLLIVGIVLKSAVVVAGVTGLVIAWFLCIDSLIVSSKISVARRVALFVTVISLPIAIALYMGT